MKHIHLIGICGSGLSAIAMILLERGFTVTGSDRQLSPLGERVQATGGVVYVGHRAEQITGADLVVRSSAIADENPEVMAARAAGIPVLKREAFLEQLTEGQQTIAIAGTHGKTTTTNMIAWVLSECSMDPSYIIGGVSSNLGNNAHAGKGDYFVIEADEYDRMFLGLRPRIAVVTNIEHDHPDCYPTPQDFSNAFHDFAARIVPGGDLLVCGDDPGAAQLGKDLSGKVHVRTYGIYQDAVDLRAEYMHPNDLGGYSFPITFGRGRGFEPVDLTVRQKMNINLQVPGKHNVQNALAALAVAVLLKLPLDKVAAALESFSGTGRRFELRGEAGGVTIIDDYAHHPTEIRATLAAARARYPDQRIIALWQPHTFSRTRTLLAEFASAFGSPGDVAVDKVLVTEVFAAREPAPMDGFSAKQVVDTMSHPDASFIPDLAEARESLSKMLRRGDVLLVLSAGDADQLSQQVLDDLKVRDQELTGRGKTS